MTYYSRTVICDNSTYGILKQYMVNGEYSTTESNPHYCNPWACGTEAIPSWNTYYNSTNTHHLIGGNGSGTSAIKYKNLLYIKTPPHPVQDAEILNVSFVSKYRNFYSNAASPICIYGLNSSFSKDSSPKYFPVQCMSVAPLRLDWNLYATDADKNRIFGDNYSSTETLYPLIMIVPTSGTGLAHVFIAFDDPVTAFAYEKHINSESADSSKVTLSTFYSSGTSFVAGSRYVDETHSLTESGRIALSVDNGVPATLTSAQVRSYMISLGLDAYTGFPSEGDILTGKYWLHIYTSCSSDTNHAHVYMCHLRNITSGAPNYNQPSSLPYSTMEWNLSPTSVAGNDDAYTFSEDYKNNNEYPFGALDVFTPNSTTWTTHTTDMTKYMVDQLTEYYIAILNHPSYDNYMNLRAISSSNTYLSLTYGYDDTNSPINTVKVVKNNGDPTKIKLEWEPLTELPSFLSMYIQMKLSSQTYWTTVSGAITNISAKDYVIIDTTYIKDDSGGADDAGADTTDTPQTNDRTFDIRIKVKLSETGYTSGNGPIFYSNTVQSYRPGASSFTTSHIAPITQKNIIFSYASTDPNDSYPISKRIITWGDGSISEEKIDPTTQSADSGTVTHKYNLYKDFSSSRPTIQWETEQGLRSVAYNCTTSFYIKDSPGNSILSVPKTTINVDESIVLNASNSKVQSDSLASGYLFYNGSSFVSQTNPTYALTPSTIGTLKVCASILDDNNIYGTGFDWMGGFSNTYSEFVYYAATDTGTNDICSIFGKTTGSADIILGECVGPTANHSIFLMSKTPFNGFAFALNSTLNVGHPLTLKYWDGSTFKALTPTDGSLTGQDTDFHMVLWNTPSDEAPMSTTTLATYITLPDTTTPLYIVMIESDQPKSTFNMKITKLTKGLNLHTITVVDNTPILINDLKDTKVFQVNHELPRTWLKNIRDGNAGVSLFDGGFGGHTLSGNGVVLKDNSLTTGRGLGGYIKFATAFADGSGGYTTVTCTGHGFKEGDRVNITKSSLYGGQYHISSVGANSFKIRKTYTSTDTAMVTNMSSYDILKRIQIDGSYVQISGSNSEDLYRGYANISFSKTNGDTNMVPFKFTVQVDSVLVFVEETFTNTTGSPWNGVLGYYAADIDGDGAYIDDIVLIPPFNENMTYTVTGYTPATKTVTYTQSAGSPAYVKVRYWTSRYV